MTSPDDTSIMGSLSALLYEGGGPAARLADWCQDPVDLAVSSPGPPLKTGVSVHNERWRSLSRPGLLNPDLRWCEGRWILLSVLGREHRRIPKVRLPDFSTARSRR